MGLDCEMLRLVTKVKRGKKADLDEGEGEGEDWCRGRQG